MAAKQYYLYDDANRRVIIRSTPQPGLLLLGPVGKRPNQQEMEYYYIARVGMQPFPRIWYIAKDTPRKTL